MATFLIFHGGGTRGSTFDLLADELHALGHHVVAPDLPIDEPDGDLSRCARAALEQVGDDVVDLVVVGHSFGGLMAPLAAAWGDARLLVLMSAMVPAPGETAGDWWQATGWVAQMHGVDMSDDIATYLHDVPPDIAAEDLARVRDHGDASSLEPWPLDAWPDVPTRVLAFADDRFLPLEFQERIAQERIGVTATAMGGSHCAYLSRPAEVAAHLDGFWREVSAGEQAIDRRGAGRT